jgi:hypothetical protein
MCDPHLYCDPDPAAEHLHDMARRRWTCYLGQDRICRILAGVYAPFRPATDIAIPTGSASATLKSLPGA